MKAALMIEAGYTTGIANMGEYLTTEQAREILHKALDDTIAALPKSSRALLKPKMLRQIFDYGG
jgi:hypothetical protein